VISALLATSEPSTLDDIAAERARRAAAAPSAIWDWITRAVWTIDEADLKRPIKPFPAAACVPCQRYLAGWESDECPQCGAPGSPLTYLRLIAEQWATGAPPLLLVPKARRMRISWLMVACHVWLAVHHKAAAIYIVSSKEGKSRELVDRAEGILRRMVPVGGAAVPRWTVAKDPPTITFPDLGSKIVGVPEGADQLRQYTATAILCDEFATWAWARASYVAMKPTIEGGGRITVVSSAYPGFFLSLISGEVAA